MLNRLIISSNHQFIADDLSILDSMVFDHEQMRTSRQITDTYLLALAAHHDAVLATFDRRIVTDAVRLPNASIHPIGQDV